MKAIFHEAIASRALLCWLLLLAGPGAWGQSATFSYTGGAQSYAVPAGATQLFIEAIGGQGGIPSGTSNSQAAIVRAAINASPGENLTVLVGGAGKVLTTGSAGGAGGYNGGGAGANGLASATYNGGGGGGGATELNRSGSRVVVAGGGGGEGGRSYPYYYGGAGGNASFGGVASGSDGDVGRYNGNPVGGKGGSGASTSAAGAGGGSSSSGGAAGAAGSGGGGGSGGSSSTGGGGGGGGGGYYGGGGGGGDGIGVGGGGGGAGSSYVLPSGIVSGTTVQYTPGGYFGGAGNGALFVTPLPVLTSASPASGAAGSTITLNGRFLANTYSIVFAGSSNNYVLNGFTVNAAGTQITGITVPSGATTGNMVVRTQNPYGTVTPPGNGVLFTLVNLPTISGFTPGSGFTGTTSVTVTGTNLTGATAVAFNGTAATGYTVNAAGTQLTVTAPVGATTGPIAVTTPGGTATSSDNFTVLNPPTTFAYTGAAQTYTVPAGVTRLQVSAQGGGYSTGKGGVTTAVLAVTPGEVLTVVAGGAGKIGLSSAPYTAGAGGYNGGASGGVIAGGSLNGGYKGGDGGSGASDIRRIAGASAVSPLAGGTLASTAASRLLVAGGAGGGGANAGAAFAGTANGGAGTTSAGGVPGVPTLSNGTPDTSGPQINGFYFGSGMGGYYAQGGLGGDGMGGNAPNPDNYGGGGGGGGYYGGGGGAGGGYGTCGCQPHVAGAGGGGSSYAVPATLASGSTPTYALASTRFDGSTDNGGLTLTPVYAVPLLSALSPASGAVGNTMTINGADLGSTTAITFAGASNNVVNTGFTVNAAGTQITGIVVPSGAVTGSVTATTPGGISNGLLFTLTNSDLTISTGTATSPVAIAPGTYNSITITSSGVAALTGSTVVNTSISVSGALGTNCQVLTGAASFTVAAGGILGICDPAGLSSTASTGAVQTTGTRSFSTAASYLYNGTAAQVTGNALPTQVLNLATTNAQNVTLTQPVRVKQVVSIGAAGNLVLNGQALTLLSDASGTALIANTGSGVVQGAAGTMQRYLDASANTGTSGYRHYSAPVSGSTVADLATTATGGSFTPTVNGAYNTSNTPSAVTPFPTVYGYDETRLATSPATGISAFDKGFYSPTAPTDALVPGRGYTVQIGNSELVDFTGTFTTGPQTIGGLTRGTAADAGWALVGNPYPAPLDWSTVSSGQLTNVNAAIYISQSTAAYAGQYRSLVNGIGSGASLIPAGQGFFVRASTPGTTGSIALTNANRVTTFGAQPAVQRLGTDPRPLLRLSLVSGTQPATTTTAQDEAFVYFETGATANFDGQFDADKLLNSNGYYLATATPGSSPVGLSVDGRAPLSQVEEVIPVWLGAPAGTYTLTATELANFSSLAGGTTVYLRDALTGTLTNLATAPSYSFSVAAGAGYSGRFALVFRPAAALATTASQALSQVLASVYPNPAAASAGVVLAVTGLPATTPTLEVLLLNTLGQQVSRCKLTASHGAAQLHLPTAGLGSGVYLLRLNALNAQGQVVGQLPAQRLSLQ